jgi:predicted aspartyl protease
MGEVRVDIKLKCEKGEIELKNILVDTGATYTVLNKNDLEKVGAYKMRDAEVMLGNGEKIRSEIYAAILKIGERESSAPILTFEGAKEVIGQLTLEELGLKVDLTKEKLEPIREANLAYFF